MKNLLILLLLLILLTDLTFAKSFVIYNVSNPSQTYFIVSGQTGYVGIGTSSPGYPLDVVGDIHSSGYVRADAGLCISNDCKTSWSEIGGNVGGSGSVGQVAFWINSNTISGDNNLYWDNTNKKLGIRTTSPEYTLDVNGSLRASISLTGGINVETLTSDKILVPGQDEMYQWLKTGGADRVIYLNTSKAHPGDRFIIRNDDNYDSPYYLEIRQGDTTLDYIFAQSIREYIFDGTNWVAGDVGTGTESDYNVAIGYGTLAYNYGTAVGYYAAGNTYGTAVGYGAFAHTSGTAVGYLTDGYSYGTAIGAEADGDTYGTAVGFNARGYNYGVAVGYYARGMRYGVAVGYGAGFNLDTGADRYNVLVGAFSGYQLTTGKGNIIIGYQAGYDETYSPTTGSYNILIGYNAWTPSNDTSSFLNIGGLIFGTNLSTSPGEISTGKVGIGTTSPDYKLDVAGDIRTTGDLICTDCIALGTETSGNYVASISAGGGISISGGTGEGVSVTISHADTSSQSSVDNSDLNFIQDVTLDTYGHVTGLASATIVPGNALSASGTTLNVNVNTNKGLQIVSDALEVKIGTGLAFDGSGNIYVKYGDTSGTAVEGDTQITINAGSGLTGGGTITLGAGGSVTISHDDTSTQSSVDNSGGTVIQDITLDTYGHVTGINSVNLDNRYVQGAGSGSANYLTKWSSSNTLTTSQIYDDGSKVGIGTTSPSAKLDVAGETRATIFKDRDNTGYYVDPASTSYLYRLGIANEIYSNGDIRIDLDENNDGTNYFRIYNGGDSQVFYVSEGGLVYASGDGIFKNVKLRGQILYSDANIYLDLDNNNDGTNYLYVRNGGNTIVAQIDEAGNLQIAGDLTLSGQDIKDAGGTSRIQIIDNGDMYLKEDGGAIILDVDANGNIGIGTTSPAKKLDVNGEVLIRNKLYLDSNYKSEIYWDSSNNRLVIRVV